MYNPYADLTEAQLSSLGFTAADTAIEDLKARGVKLTKESEKVIRLRLADATEHELRAVRREARESNLAQGIASPTTDS